MVRLQSASLHRGSRALWSDMSAAIRPGEFVAVLGPNGAGKTSFLRVLLGLLPLSSGTVTINGVVPRRGSAQVGYVPQQKGFDPDLGARARDLVALGIDGHRYWRPFSSRQVRRRVDQAIEAVGATRYQDSPIGRLSGGEQQRLRIAQALIGDPAVLLCDEPLLSLDLHHQRAVLELIDDRRRRAGTAVVMVTHEINPVLPLVDKVLYLVDGRWVIGTPAEVMTSHTLSELYGTQVEVIEIRGRLLIMGAADDLDLAVPVEEEPSLTDRAHEHHDHQHEGRVDEGVGGRRGIHRNNAERTGQGRRR